MSLAKKSHKMCRATGVQIRFGGHLCGNTGSAVALTSSFRASINADKIPSPSLFLSYVTLDRCFDKRKNKVVARGKSVSRGDKNSSKIYDMQMIYDKKFFTLELLISLIRGIYVPTSYWTSFVQRGLRVSLPESATISIKLQCLC